MQRFNLNLPCGRQRRFGTITTQTDNRPEDRETHVIRDGHDNFFTPLRLLFASLVVIGHAFVIAMRDPTLEPHIFYHYTFSYMAVNMFFIASGFLVTKSMVYRGDTPSFLSARALRIFPALVVHVIFVMIVIGPLATSLPLKAFFSSPDWYLQPVKVLTFYKTGMVMPGAFEGNAENFGSAPLWTLRYEVLAYIATLGVFSLGLLKRKWMALAQFILPSIAWIIFTQLNLFENLPATLNNMCRFGIAYGLGATIYAYRDRLTFHWVSLFVLLALSWMFRSTPVVEVIMNLILAWVVFKLAYIRAPRFAFLQKLPDLSYGIYIYHWCVLQMLFHWMPDLSVLTLFVLGFPPTVVLAALSWYIIEKPMLKSKTRFANWLRDIGLKQRKPSGAMLLD